MISLVELPWDLPCSTEHTRRPQDPPRTTPWPELVREAVQPIVAEVLALIELDTDAPVGSRDYAQSARQGSGSLGSRPEQASCLAPKCTHNLTRPCCMHTLEARLLDWRIVRAHLQHASWHHVVTDACVCCFPLASAPHADICYPTWPHIRNMSQELQTYRLLKLVGVGCLLQFLKVCTLREEFPPDKVKSQKDPDLGFQSRANSYRADWRWRPFRPGSRSRGRCFSSHSLHHADPSALWSWRAQRRSRVRLRREDFSNPITKKLHLREATALRTTVLRDRQVSS